MALSSASFIYNQSEHVKGEAVNLVSPSTSLLAATVKLAPTPSNSNALPEYICPWLLLPEVSCALHLFWCFYCLYCCCHYLSSPGLPLKGLNEKSFNHISSPLPRLLTFKSILVAWSAIK